MARIVYKHRHIVKYEFDTSNITESNHREVMKRHYDFLNWCEFNTDSLYLLDRQYNSNGITVSFKSEQDYQTFLDYVATYYCIFLHN